MTIHKYPPHVLHIVGTPAGGIRRHIHTILFGLKDIKQSYACSVSGGDAGFRRDIPALNEVLPGRLLDLNISKKPALSDIPNLIRLVRYVKAHKVTIIHGHGAKGGAYARLLSALCGIKSVYTPHGGSVHKMFGRLEEIVYTAAEKLLFRFTGYFLFESKYSAEAYFEKVGRKPEHFKVNYSGIPIPDLGAIRDRSAALGYFPAPHDPPHIGVFAILRPQKGQLCAIKAMAELKTMNVNAILHFYGAGPIKPSLEKAVAAHGIKDRVVFHNDVADPDAHMFAMDVVLIPSFYESFGYVAIEAFSLKKPVIATAVGGLREIIRDGRDGLLVEAGDSLALAKACAKLISAPLLAEQLAANGYSRYSSDFSEGRMLAGIKEIYLKIEKEHTHS
jgi:glycosyltransferase involved in cell wall biosynthesis